MPYAIPPNMLAKFGRHGDTMVAHITRKEAEKLSKDGGSWTKNPWTGLPEFWGGADQGGESDTAMGDTGGGFVDGFGGDTPGYGPGTQNFAGIEGPTNLSSILGDMAANASYNASIERSEGGGAGMAVAPGRLTGIPRDLYEFYQDKLAPFGKRVGKYASTITGAKVGGVFGAAALTPFGLTALGYGLGTVGGAWGGKKAFDKGFTAPTPEQLALAEGALGASGEGGNGNNDGYVGAIPRTEQATDPYANLKKLFFGNALADKYANRQQRVSLMGYGIPYARR